MAVWRSNSELVSFTAGLLHRNFTLRPLGAATGGLLRLLTANRANSAWPSHSVVGAESTGLSWKNNRGSGVALATRHTHVGIFNYALKGLQPCSQRPPPRADQLNSTQSLIV